VGTLSAVAVALLLAAGPEQVLRPAETSLARAVAQPMTASAAQSVAPQQGLPSLHVPGTEKQPQAGPKPTHGELADPALAEVVDDVLAGRPVDDDVARVRDGLIRVEVVSDGQVPLAAIRAVGGQVVGSVKGLALADVPAAEIAGLEARPDVAYVRFPQSVSLPEPGDDGKPPTDTTAARGSRGGEPVVKTGVDLWQAAGQIGQGVKVGIIDNFSLATWNAAIAAGELAGPPAGGFCQDHGVGCAATFWNHGNHGVAVAEVITDMAPGATMYLADISDAIDMKAAVDWFAANGVRIITKSSTGVYDGPGNGQGPFAQVIAYAESRGIAWFNSAGNAAGVAGSRLGSYFRSGWVDTDNDGWMNFPGGSEYLRFRCAFISGLRWNDWATNRTDYDLYVYEDTSGAASIASSVLDQQAGADPLETFKDGGGCTGTDDDYIAIKLFAAGNGTAGDILEFMVNGTGVDSWSNPYSVTQPAGDVATPGAAVIGAIDPVNGTTIAPYSSQGPTNDGRIKPDLSAASNFSNFSEGMFNGTSAATPVVAGAAAVLLGANPTWTPAQLVATMRGQVVDRGVPGPDNVYGTGELHLSPPAAGPPGPAGPAGTSPGKVRRLGVHGPAWAVKRRVTWSSPKATGGLPILQYAVTVYAGRKRILSFVRPGGKQSAKLHRSDLEEGRLRVYVAAYNAAGWGPWASDSFLVRRP